MATGLAGQETTRTWNGTGTGTATRERHNDNGSREYQVTGELTITNVVVPVPRGQDGWPISGTITRHATITVVGGPNDGTTRERTVIITFNGTRLVPIQVNENHFTFDLETRTYSVTADVAGRIGAELGVCRVPPHRRLTLRRCGALPTSHSTTASPYCRPRSTKSSIRLRSGSHTWSRSIPTPPR